MSKNEVTFAPTRSVRRNRTRCASSYACLQYDPSSAVLAASPSVLVEAWGSLVEAYQQETWRRLAVVVACIAVAAAVAVDSTLGPLEVAGVSWRGNLWDCLEDG
jgi:hypothetical protein